VNFERAHPYMGSGDYSLMAVTAVRRAADSVRVSGRSDLDPSSRAVFIVESLCCRPSEVDGS